MTYSGVEYLVLNECRTAAESIQAFCLRYFPLFRIPGDLCTSGMIEELGEKYQVTIVSGADDKSHSAEVARLALSIKDKAIDNYFSCNFGYDDMCRTLIHIRDPSLHGHTLQYVFFSRVEPSLLPPEPPPLLLRSLVAMSGYQRCSYLETLAEKASELGLERLHARDLAGCFSRVMALSSHLDTSLKVQKGVVLTSDDGRSLGVFAGDLADIFCDSPKDRPIGNGADSVVHRAFSPLQPDEKLVVAETRFRGLFAVAVQKVLNACPYIVPVFRNYGPYVRSMCSSSGELRREVFTKSVMPFYPGGNLESFCARREGEKPLPLAEGLHLLKQILLGVMFIHAKGYAHTDLCPANVVLKDQKEKGLIVGIIDLGGVVMAKDLLERRHMHTLYTPPQQASEITHRHVDPVQSLAGAVDVWQMGILATRLFFGREPHLYDEDLYVSLAALKEKEGTWIRDFVNETLLERPSYYEGTPQVAVSNQLSEWLQLLLQPDIRYRCSINTAFLELLKLEQKLVERGLVGKPPKLPFSLESLRRISDKATASSAARASFPSDASTPALPGLLSDEPARPVAFAAWTTFGTRSPLAEAAAAFTRGAHGGAGRSSSPVKPIYVCSGLDLVGAAVPASAATSDERPVGSVKGGDATPYAVDAAARPILMHMRDLEGGGGAGGAAVSYVERSSMEQSAFIDSELYSWLNKAAALERGVSPRTCDGAREVVSVAASGGPNPHPALAEGPVHHVAERRAVTHVPVTSSWRCSWR